jgi:hypothetical protein
MKSAMFILGLLVGGNHGDGLVAVVDPIQPVQPVIQVSAVFDEPVPADIQLLETTEYGWVGCDSSYGCCDDWMGDVSCKIKYDLCNPPTDMVPHTPYCAEPKTYYYFRPYNWAHVGAMQSHAMSWGVEPATPYSNKLFQDVYSKIEEEIRGESKE